MASVALDIFSMPTTVLNKKKYDAMVVCVDRHSGWMVAVPCLLKGLTGAKVAQKMLKYQWQIFGIPNVITSDQGSHFFGSWFETLAAGLGVRHVCSHAYHHQANGRAEMAGQQLMERLRKMNAKENINCVNALNCTLRQLHDVPGQCGLSPYKILFGRDRNLPNVPWNPPRICEDAEHFWSA